MTDARRKLAEYVELMATVWAWKWPESRVDQPTKDAIDRVVVELRCPVIRMELPAGIADAVDALERGVKWKEFEKLYPALREAALEWGASMLTTKTEPVA